MNKSILDLYSVYLICSYKQTPAKRLSKLLQGAISHDKTTRSLAESIPQPKGLWKLVKPSVRTIEYPEGVMVVDDSIEEKPYTEENDIVC